MLERHQGAGLRQLEAADSRGAAGVLGVDLGGRGAGTVGRAWGRCVQPAYSDCGQLEGAWAGVVAAWRRASRGRWNRDDHPHEPFPREPIGERASMAAEFAGPAGTVSAANARAGPGGRRRGSGHAGASAQEGLLGYGRCPREHLRAGRSGPTQHPADGDLVQHCHEPGARKAGSGGGHWPARQWRGERRAEAAVCVWVSG